MNEKFYTPSQYGELISLDIPDTIQLDEFDEITSKHCLWNYPLDEHSHIVENDLKVVVVRFNNGECRFVEIR